jgi:hypothetical protein
MPDELRNDLPAPEQIAKLLSGLAEPSATHGLSITR